MQYFSTDVNSLLGSPTDFPIDDIRHAVHKPTGDQRLIQTSVRPSSQMFGCNFATLTNTNVAHVPHIDI